jgi:predicted AAA+ superfamily ATPase
MIARDLYNIAFSGEWGRQMRFITGPRQVGKTTLARRKLQEENCENLYYLWDLRTTRQRYKDNELFFTQDTLAAEGKEKYWLCFDEIHKLPKWKNIIKAAFDETGEKYFFIVTGSAKLNIFKQAGDSLAGRYFTFHLFPLSLREITGSTFTIQDVPEKGIDFITRQIAADEKSYAAMESLLTFSGFPEPFLQQSKAFHKKWTRDYLETIIYEDIASLTRIVDRENIYDLYHLLPEMVGSPLSHSSLAGHLQISPVTVKNYLRRLEDFYLAFSLRPYVKNIKRSLLKAPKFYLYDWTQINNEAARFENYVACELKNRIMLWGDATGDEFQLFYIRNKQKQETDFLILRDLQPWLLVEVKISDGSLAGHHFANSQALGGIPLVQVCRQPGILSQQGRVAFRMSAGRFLG